MAYIQTEVEDAIRINGDNALRTLQRNIRPVVCSFAETQIYQHGGLANGGGFALRGVPRAGGVQRTRSDAPDDNDDNFDPFADWQSSEPAVYPDNIDELDSRTAYLIGRSHGKEEQFQALMPAIDAAIERVSR